MWFVQFWNIDWKIVYKMYSYLMSELMRETRMQQTLTISLQKHNQQRYPIHE